MQPSRVFQENLLYVFLFATMTGLEPATRWLSAIKDLIAVDFHYCKHVLFKLLYLLSYIVTVNLKLV